MLAQQRTALTFGHATPDAEFDAIVEGVGAAFELDRTVTADRCGLALRGSPNEKFIGVSPSAAGLRHPGQAFFSGGNCRCRHPPTPVCRCPEHSENADRQSRCSDHYSMRLLGESHSALNLGICAWVRNPWAKENGTYVQATIVFAGRAVSSPL